MLIAAIGAQSFVRGLLTLILFLAFMTLWAWAWNKNRQADFDHVARMPLEDHDQDSLR